MIIKNKTYYTHPQVRTSIKVPDPSLYSSERSRARSFDMRLGYEFEYCQLSGGVCFFVTFTYNDKSVISIDGENYCNNLSFRSLMVNHLYHRISRKHHCSIRYFCTGELGDGKGERGFNNNPHLHVLFFVYPIDEDSKLPTADQFEYYCKDYWRGTSKSPKDAPFGIVSGSDKGLIVQTKGALRYTSKYCIKDSLHKSKLLKLKHSIDSRLVYSGYDYTHGSYTYVDNYETIKDFLKFYNSGFRIDSYESFNNYVSNLLDCLASYGFLIQSEHIFDYLKRRILYFLAPKLLPKVLLSNGLGIYGVEVVKQRISSGLCKAYSPKLPYGTGSQGSVIVEMPIPLYYYRKIYCDVVITHRFKETSSPWSSDDCRFHREVRYVKNSFWESSYLDSDVFNRRIDYVSNQLYSLLRYNSSINPYHVFQYLSEHIKSPLLSIPNFQLFHASLTLRDISFDIVRSYVIYNTVYFGRNAVVQYDSFPTLYAWAFHDYCNFYELDKSAPYSLSPTPLLDVVPSDSFFTQYLPHFTLIYAFETYFILRKDSKSVKDHDEFRRTRRALFSPTSKDKPL